MLAKLVVASMETRLSIAIFGCLATFVTFLICSFNNADGSGLVEKLGAKDLSIAAVSVVESF